MKNLPAELQDKLDGGATTICRCWKIARPDGIVLGFTDHDRDLGFDGVLFEAASGLAASSLQRSTGLSVDNIEAEGALTSEAISAADLDHGLYDGAEVFIWLVDWTNTALRALTFRGELGASMRGEHSFTAEILSQSERLNKAHGRAFLFTCDADLGDLSCGVDLSLPQYRGRGVVISSEYSRKLVISGIDQFAAGWFARGRLLWRSGANTGASSPIKSHRFEGASVVIELWTQAFADIATGDQLDLTAGCDKFSETCFNKFNNILNFRGFPHIPGDDWITSYPNRGEGNNGGRL